MESTDKNYWLYLEPDVFIFQEKKKTILYNSLSKKIIDVEYSAEVNSLIQQFLNPNNVYVITLTSSELLNQSIDNFVNVIREAYFGDIIQQRDNNKPVIIPPILKIHKNREFLKRDHEIALGENIISKLEEITLHLNGECYQNCEFCGKINQQFNFCCKNNGELGIESIKNLFSRLQYSRSRVIFTGGNVFKYSNYYTLLDLLKRYGFKTIFCFHYLN
jgi:pseudo-rSAM protein